MAHQPSCSNVRVFYPDANPSRVPFSVMGNADFFLMCAEEPSPTLWVAFSLRISRFFSRHVCKASLPYTMRDIASAHMSGLCHSEQQRRIWRTHFIYIIVSQILHSACGFVQDDRENVQDDKREAPFIKTRWGPGSYGIHPAHISLTEQRTTNILLRQDTGIQQDTKSPCS